MEGKIFKYEHIKHYEIIPPDLRIFMGVDLAISQKESADFVAIATIGKNEFGQMFLIDMFHERLSFLQTFSKIRQKSDQYHPLRVFIESNAYQDSQAQILAALTDVPVKPFWTHKDKVVRAWRLSAKFENGLMYFPKYGVAEFTDNLIAFPDAEHDDEFDALDFAVMGSFLRMRKPRKTFGVI